MTLPDTRKTLGPGPDENPRPRRAVFFLACLVALLTGLGGGTWICLKNEDNKKQQRQTRIEFLANQGSIMVENRRWQDAAAAFAEIESIDPSSTLVQRGERGGEPTEVAVAGVADSRAIRRWMLMNYFGANGRMDGAGDSQPVSGEQHRQLAIR